MLPLEALSQRILLVPFFAAYVPEKTDRHGVCNGGGGKEWAAHTTNTLLLAWLELAKDLELVEK